MQDAIIYTTVPSPIGEMLICGRGETVTMAHFAGQHRTGPYPRPGWERDDTVLVAARRQLTEYFAGERQHFDLELEPAGTPFQLQAWLALRSIGFGETISYGEQARRIGRPKASRAVGGANGANPISIIVPCHRVIGADGRLTGFGSGIDRKAWLLEHEQTVIS